MPHPDGDSDNHVIFPSLLSLALTTDNICTSAASTNSHFLPVKAKQIDLLDASQSDEHAEYDETKYAGCLRFT